MRPSDAEAASQDLASEFPHRSGSPPFRPRSPSTLLAGMGVQVDADTDVDRAVEAGAAALRRPGAVARGSQVPVSVSVPASVLASVPASGSVTGGVALPAEGRGAGSVRSDRAPWGRIHGQDVECFTLRNRSGITLRVIGYGARIVELHTPDRSGVFADVVLGYDALEPYVACGAYLGCVVGRCANRISGGRAVIDGRIYELAANQGANHLHGGVHGFDRRVWRGTLLESEDRVSLMLIRRSEAGEEGYPGAMRVAVTYTLTDADELETEFTATTSEATLCNMVQHTYWNLAGHDGGDVLGHELRVRADRYTPVDRAGIPTGRIAPVAGTPLDFREARPIGDHLLSGGVAGAPGPGIDHNFVIDGPAGRLRAVATLRDPGSGRVLSLWSDQPGLQVYTANHLGAGPLGKRGAVYRRRHGVCLETQLFPDAANRPGWPSPLLRPGEIYRHRMVHRFGTDADVHRDGGGPAGIAGR